MEYIHHFWMGIASTHNQEDYIVAIPEKAWVQSSGLLDWPKCDNIHLRLLSDNELDSKSDWPIFKRSAKECGLIKKIVNEWGGGKYDNIT